MISKNRCKSLFFFRRCVLICFLGLAIVPCCDKKPSDPNSERKWVASNAGLDNLYIEYLAVHPVNPSVLFAGTFDGLYRSTNGGRSWTRVDSSWAYAQIASVAFDPLQAEVIYVGTKGSGVFKSTDGGSHWEQRNTGLEDQTIYSLTAHPQHSDTLFCGGDGGIYRTFDGTDSTWTKVFWFNRTFVAIDPQNQQKIYAGGQYNNFYKSTEGGENGTWAASAEGLLMGGPESRIQWVLVDPVDYNTIYAASNSIGVYKSTNAAAQWMETNTGLGTKAVRVLASDPSDHQHLYAATNRGVAQSIDGAGSWELMNSGLSNTDVRALALHPTDEELLYAGTWGDGVFIWKVP